MRPFLFAVLVACATAVAAQAQVRTIPQEAKRGALRHVSVMLIELDGKPASLSAGAQIRDTFNRLIVPGAIPAAGVVVRYIPDSQGRLHRVWILTAEEYQQSLIDDPPPPAPQDGKK